MIAKHVFIECSRADIIAKYSGHTAKNVKNLFSKAIGGVLFIDEAYSLMDDVDRSGFGDEAINTLIQEVENHKGELVVILAGYPQKMQEFLDSNPGLKSRFSNVIRFSDYSKEELYEITSQIAEKNGFTLDGSVKNKIMPIFVSAIKEKDFGNGRFARNLVEQALLNKAQKLTAKHSNLDILSDEEIFTLSASDFEAPKNVSDCVSHKKIGFDA